MSNLCEGSSKYCEQKQAALDNIKQQLKFEGMNIGTLCNPETGVVLNLAQSPNGKLVPKTSNSTGIWTLELNRRVNMSDTTFICDGITDGDEDEFFPYDPCDLVFAKEINTELEYTANSIEIQRIEKEKLMQQKRKEEQKEIQQQEQKAAAVIWDRILHPSTTTDSTTLNSPTNVPPSENQTEVSTYDNHSDYDNKKLNIDYNYYDDLLSTDRIRDEINLRMQHPFMKRQMVKKTKLSSPVAAFIEYLLDFFPILVRKREE